AGLEIDKGRIGTDGAADDAVGAAGDRRIRRRRVDRTEIDGRKPAHEIVPARTGDRGAIGHKPVGDPAEIDADQAADEAVGRTGDLPWDGARRKAGELAADET